MKKSRSKSELVVYSKHKKEKSKLVIISRDGWVVTENGAMGDNGSDCEIVWENQSNYLKNIRLSKNLTQLEMAFILGIARTSYISLEKGRQEMTHKQYLITTQIDENF